MIRDNAEPAVLVSTDGALGCGNRRLWKALQPLEDAMREAGPFQAQLNDVGTTEGEMHDTAYYRERAHQERQAAARSADPAVRTAHEVMAGRYERLAAGERLPMGIVERY